VDFLFFTNKGRMHWLKAYEIPEGGRTGRGKALVNLIQLEPDEYVRAVINIAEIDVPERYVIMATRNGIVKKTELRAFRHLRRKGIRAIAGRVQALGMELAQTLVVPHDRDALAGALAEVAGDMVLILTGSATSDPDDVAPAALRAAGGRVERFGMPVDPGNLLFLGALGARPVIGLPGCARSPALNGADWVLSRVACGIAVTGDDIAGMGVGGLLKEIPTRPMPREKKRRVAGN